MHSVFWVYGIGNTGANYILISITSSLIIIFFVKTTTRDRHLIISVKDLLSYVTFR